MSMIRWIFYRRPRAAPFVPDSDDEINLDDWRSGRLVPTGGVALLRTPPMEVKAPAVRKFTYRRRYNSLLTYRPAAQFNTIIGAVTDAFEHIAEDDHQTAVTVYEVDGECEHLTVNIAPGDRYIVTGTHPFETRAFMSMNGAEAHRKSAPGRRLYDLKAPTKSWSTYLIAREKDGDFGERRWGKAEEAVKEAEKRWPTSSFWVREDHRMSDGSYRHGVHFEHFGPRYMEARAPVVKVEARAITECPSAVVGASGKWKVEGVESHYVGLVSAIKEAQALSKKHQIGVRVYSLDDNNIGTFVDHTDQYVVHNPPCGESRERISTWKYHDTFKDHPTYGKPGARVWHLETGREVTG